MAEKKSLPTREQADAAFLWHTQDIFESDEQFSNASVSMVVTVAGIVMLNKFEQFLNVF